MTQVNVSKGALKTMKKRKSYFSAFISKNIKLFISILFFLYMIGSGFFTKYILGDSFEAGVFLCIPMLALISFGFAGLYYLIKRVIIGGICYFISKCKAIKRYIYLPLGENEVRECIKMGIFENDVESYTAYLIKQMRYGNTYRVNYLYFNWNEINQIVETCIIVFNSPICIDVENIEDNLGPFRECCNKCNFGFKPIMIISLKDKKHYDKYRNKEYDYYDVIIIP